MFKILDLIIKPSATRIAFMRVKYYNLVINCDVCVYKKQNLWIRMPEQWIDEIKVPNVWWPSQDDSEAFQEIILDMLKKNHKLDLKKGLYLKKQYVYAKNKEDKNKKIN